MEMKSDGALIAHGLFALPLPRPDAHDWRTTQTSKWARDEVTVAGGRGMEGRGQSSR